MQKEKFNWLGDGKAYADDATQALERWGCQLSPQELDVMLGLVKVCAIAAGEVLFEEGSPATFMGILIRGQLTVHKMGQHGEACCLYQLGPGKTFGEMALVDGEPRSAELRAAQDSEFILLSLKSFQTLCKERPAIGLKFLLPLARSLSQRLRRTSGQLIDYL